MSSKWVLKHIPYESSEEDIRQAIVAEYKRKGVATGPAEELVVSHPRPKGEFAGRGSKNPGFCIITLPEQDVGTLQEVMRGFRFSARRQVELERCMKSGDQSRGKVHKRPVKTYHGNHTVIETPVQVSKPPVPPELLKQPLPEDAHGQPRLGDTSEECRVEGAPVLAPVSAAAPQVEVLSLTQFAQVCLQAEKHKPPAAGDIGLGRCRAARGFINRGNTCFRNAALHALFSAPPLAALLVTLVKSLKHPMQIPPQYKVLPELLRVAWNLYLSPAPGGSIDSSGGGGGGSGRSDSFVGLMGAPIDVARQMPHITQEFRRSSQQSDLGDPSSPGDKRYLDRQEDAMEFLTFLLDAWHKEEVGIYGNNEGVAVTGDAMRPAPPAHHEAEEDDEWQTVEKANVKVLVDSCSKRRATQANTLVSRLMHVRVRSTLQYSGKKVSSSTFVAERFLSLSISDLAIGKANASVQAALEGHFKAESVEGVAKGDVGGQRGGYHSNSKTRASHNHKKCVIDSLAPVLILQLSRFYFDQSSMRAKKVHKRIAYDSELRIPASCCSQSLRDKVVEKAGAAGAGGEEKSLDRKKGSDESVLAKYDLCGVVLHHGESADSGHYTSVTRHGSWDDGQWAHLDDQKVVPWTQGMALGCEEEVYILIYSQQEVNA